MQSNERDNMLRDYADMTTASLYEDYDAVKA